jgi:ethanolamine permease
MYQLTELVPQASLPDEQLLSHHSHHTANSGTTTYDQKLETVEDGLPQEDDFQEDSMRSDDSPNKSGLIGSEKKKTLSARIASFWDVFGFGICLASANLTYGAWHVGLFFGFWSFFFATVIMMSVFFCVHFCIAEMISVLPFSGGMYGFARVTVGPYFGFLVGCFESMGNVIYAMIGMLSLGAYLSYILDLDKKWEPIYWLGFYLIIITNEFLGRKYYFRLMRTVAIIIVLIFLLYICVSINNVHPKKYLPQNAINQTFLYGADLTIISLQFSAWIYFGLEVIPLVSDEVKNARRDTPRALIATVCFVTVFAFIIMFFNYCQSPGYPWDPYLHKSPLNSGFVNTFKITDQMATVFAFVPYMATVSIYVFGFAKQMKALGASKLLPPIFSRTLGESNVPHVSLLVGCAFGYGLLLIAYFRGEIYTTSSLPVAVYIAAYIGTYLTYILVLISFIIFRVKYWNLKREFTSPLGIAGAVYGICGMLVLAYILIRYSSKSFTDVKIFACFVGIISVYYFLYARYKQTFSEEEQKVMFVVYLMQCKCLFPSIFNHFSNSL